MKNILVLTDFSENAIAAEQYALELAMHADADLILYNVYPHRRPSLSGNIVWPHDEPARTFELQSISNLQSRVNELNHQLVKIKDTPHKPSISHLGSEGSVTHQLNDVIVENNIWLVVMGTKGESFATDVVFGSNVYNVLETIKVPVLVIPQSSQYKNLKKIAYATDFRSSDIKVIEWLHEFEKALKIELSVVHVSADIANEQEKDISKRQEEVYREKFPEITVKIYEGENTHDALHKIADQTNSDVLALMHRRHGFFDSLFHPSTSHKMIKHTEIPILVFPEPHKEG